MLVAVAIGEAIPGGVSRLVMDLLDCNHFYLKSLSYLNTPSCPCLFQRSHHPVHHRPNSPIIHIQIIFDVEMKLVDQVIVRKKGLIQHPVSLYPLALPLIRY